MGVVVGCILGGTGISERFDGRTKRRGEYPSPTGAAATWASRPELVRFWRAPEGRPRSPDHGGGGVNVPGGGANPPSDGGGATSGGGGGAAAVVGRLRFFGGGGGCGGVAGCKAANTGLGSNCVAVPDDPTSPDSPDRGRTGTVCGR